MLQLAQTRDRPAGLPPSTFHGLSKPWIQRALLCSLLMLPRTLSHFHYDIRDAYKASTQSEATKLCPPHLLTGCHLLPLILQLRGSIPIAMDFYSTGYRSIKPWFTETKGNSADNMDYELSKTDTPTADLHTMHIQPFRRPYGSVVLFHFCQFDGKRVISSLPSGQPHRAVIGNSGLQRGLMP
jgi:hypothetical protein